jgi:hypothetical protein
VSRPYAYRIPLSTEERVCFDAYYLDAKKGRGLTALDSYEREIASDGLSRDAALIHRNPARFQFRPQRIDEGAPKKCK